MRIRWTKNSTRGHCKKGGTFKGVLQSQWQNRKKTNATFSQWEFFQSSTRDFIISLFTMSRSVVLTTASKTSTLLLLAQSGVWSKLFPVIYMCVHRHTWITFLIKAFKHCCDSNNNTNNGLTSSGHQCSWWSLPSCLEPAGNQKSLPIIEDEMYREWKFCLIKEFGFQSSVVQSSMKPANFKIFREKINKSNTLRPVWWNSIFQWENNCINFFFPLSCNIKEYNNIAPNNNLFKWPG